MVTDGKRRGDFPIGTKWPKAEDTSPDVFVARDHQGRSVVLTQQQWEVKILRDHPDLAAWLNYVEWTITKPDFVTQDKTNPRRECYYLSLSDRPDRPRHIKVVVQIDDSIRARRGTDGYIVTAHFTRRLSPLEVRLWP